MAASCTAGNSAARKAKLDMSVGLRLQLRKIFRKKNVNNPKGLHHHTTLRLYATAVLILHAEREWQGDCQSWPENARCWSEEKAELSLSNPRPDTSRSCLATATRLANSRWSS